MIIRYTDLGADLQLNEVVIAGSHDAGITSGGHNVQTQDRDIFDQACAGVRFFDIRIAAFATGNKSFGAKQVELKSFHADDLVHKKHDKVRSVVGISGRHDVKRSKLIAGAEGLGLRKILSDAKDFVESAVYSGEFIILKFDKCQNWPLIAQTCRDVLGTALYTGGGNINTKTLADLAGKVICAFMPDGMRELKTPMDQQGITPIRNLFKPPSGYDASYRGLQYWGSGGTGINNKGFEDKIRENIAKQSKILQKAAQGVTKTKGVFRKTTVQLCPPVDPNALGMMYWTTTGVNKSIRERNDRMWDANHKQGLSDLWTSSYSEYVKIALPKSIDEQSFSSGGTLKLFMPNVVMIDFANKQRCKEIYDLNTVAATRLVDVCRKLDIHGGRNG